MPEFKVTNPETQRTYKITAPEDATDEQLTARAKEFEAQEDLPSYNFGDEVMNSATFGLSGKASAMGRAFSDYVMDKEGDGYLGDPSKFEMSDLYNFPKIGKRESQFKTARDQYREKNPTESLIGSIGGGMANPLGNVLSKYAMGGKLTGSGLNPATKMGIGRAKALGKKKQGLGQAIGRGSATGAGMAGFQAYNEADGDFLDRLSAGTEAGALGGIVGGGIPAIVRGVSSGIKGVANQFVRGSKQQQRSLALRKVAEALEADGLTPQQAIDKIKRLGAEGALLDAGDYSRQLAYAVSKRNEAGAKDIDTFLDNRQFGNRGLDNEKISGQVNRIDKSLDDLGYGGEGRKEELALIQKEATALYDKANNANIDIEDATVNSILNRLPEQLKADARQAMMLRGENVSKVNPEMTALGREQGITTGKGIGEGLKLKYLDSIKKQLWDASEVGKDIHTGKRTDIGRAYNQLRIELTSALDKADTTGFYKQARAKAGDGLSNESAFVQGQKFMSKSEFRNPEELREALAEMSPSEIDHFRIGVVEQTKNLLNDVVEGGDATKRLMGKKNIEERLMYAFEGDEGLFKKYIDALKNEKEMYRSFGMKGNSQTAEKLNAMMQAGKDPAPEIQGFMDIASGQNKTGGLMKIGQGIKNRLTMPDLQTKELAKMLTGKGENLVEDLNKKYANQGLTRNVKKQLSKLGTRAAMPLIGKRKQRHPDGVITLRKGMLGR